MLSIDDLIVATLKGQRILIIEDDLEFVEYLVPLITEVTGIDPMVVDCGEQAEDIFKNPNNFALAIVDVMLPYSLEDLQEYRELEKLSHKLRRDIRKLKQKSYHPGPDTNQEIFGIRQQWSAVQHRMDNLIDRKCGLKVVEHWRAEGTKSIPILFLSALGAEDTKKKGLESAGSNAAWLTKPVPSDLILIQCAQLIRKKQIPRQSN